MNNSQTENTTPGSKRLYLINVFLYAFIVLAALLLFVFWSHSNKQSFSLEVLMDISLKTSSIEKLLYGDKDIRLKTVLNNIDETKQLFNKLIDYEKALNNKEGVHILKNSNALLDSISLELKHKANKYGILTCCPIQDKKTDNLYEEFENSIEEYRTQTSDKVIKQASTFNAVTRLLLGFFIFLIFFSVIILHYFQSSYKKYIAKINKQNIEINHTKIELEKAKKYYTNLFENMIEGVAVYELVYDENNVPIDYKIVDINEAYEKLHGLKRDDIIGINVSSLYESKKSPIFETCVNVALTRVPTRFDIYYIPMQKHLRFAVFSPEKNKFAIVFFDITESVTLYNQLKEERTNLENTIEERTKELKNALMKQKELSNHKDRFMSNMSHELRTPLNAILGFAQSLKLRIYGPVNEKQVENINLIIDSGNHLLSLIDDILDMTQIDLGSMKMEPTKVNIKSIIEETTSLMLSQYNDKVVKIEYIIKDEVEIIADERKVKQILLNLLSNALKFTPTGGKVLLTSEKYHDEYVKISVKDSGIGISKEESVKIFDEFYQIEDTNFQAKGGTGIGLALTKKMVELHNGKIFVESEENKGSIFWFILPIK